MTTADAPTPRHVIRLHGAPCHECARPAEALAIYPEGRSVVHRQAGTQPCARFSRTPEKEEQR